MRVQLQSGKRRRESIAGAQRAAVKRAAAKPTLPKDDGFRDFAESLVQHIDEVFFWKDPDSARPYYVSPAYERIWGQTCESVYSTPSSWIESIHPEDRDRVLAQFSQADSVQLEYRIFRRGQEVRWIHARTFSVLTESEAFPRIVGIAQDITERKYSERSQAFLASIVESSDDSIVGTDLDGLVMSWNQGSQKLFGYTPEEAIGQRITFLFPRNRQADYMFAIEKIRHQEHIERFESVRVAKDGTPIDVSVILSPIRDCSGALQGVSAIYRDMTAEKRAAAELLKAKEAAEAASRAKSTFLATMSHEIRTPMNGIMGMTELLLDSDLTREQRESLELVKLSTESLLSVINDILDFSKIEAGKMEFEAVSFDLRECLGEKMRTLGLRAHQKGLELVYNVHSDVPALLIGDAGRLGQIFVNLVGNAIKFTDEGEIFVNVEVEQRASENLCLHCSVRDTGIGIPPDKQRKIFEAFSQADDSMTRKYGGTGLGLTICKRLVEMMKGRLWVESVADQGSTFHFTANFGVQPHKPDLANRLEPAQLRGIPALVVDDNFTNRRVMTGLLKQWGMDVTAVEGGRAALHAFENAKQTGRPFSLVLLDGHMPEMDGFTLAEELQKHPDWSGATIMMLTSADQLGDAARCRQIGIAAYLVKPVRQSELLNMLCRSVQQHSGNSLARVNPGQTRTAGEARVLVAEDNAVNQTLIRRLLEKQGYSATVVSDGREAVAAVQRESFDVVLMDVQMPNMDGFEATGMIRENERVTGRHIPIIAMTAHALKGDDERCFAAGMDAYVAKPLRREDLYDTINRILAS